ncbi:Component of the SF3b subcomplex of the U2 snRNP [Tulasnella sp. 417]|nr:Component of the SF3b subcomplex of the U2 snRNP [Tulasnella sp. 417]
MPKIRTSRTKKPPEGFEEIEWVLDDYSNKMRDAENESHEGKRKTESLWPIMRISHTRSRYIYELYYKREAISKELYEWLLKEGYADANLIAKWKKQGYEKLCCVRCIQSRARHELHGIYLHLSGTESAVKRRHGRRVHPLRVSWV